MSHRRADPRDRLALAVQGTSYLRRAGGTDGLQDGLYSRGESAQLRAGGLALLRGARKEALRIGDERVGTGLEMSCDEGLVGLRLAREVVTCCGSDAFASAEYEPEDRQRDQSRRQRHNDEMTRRPGAPTSVRHAVT